MAFFTEWYMFIDHSRKILTEYRTYNTHHFHGLLLGLACLFDFHPCQPSLIVTDGCMVNIEELNYMLENLIGKF